MQGSKVYRHKKTEEGVKATFITEPKTYQIGVNMYVESEAGHYLVEWGQGCITPIKQEVFEKVFEIDKALNTRFLVEEVYGEFNF